MSHIIEINTPCHVMGDIHAKTEYLDDFASRHPGESLIILGDCGFGFAPGFPSILSRMMERHNIHLYCLRGNHDDPAAFTGQVNHGFLHILPDYTRLIINGMNSLAIGGGISIDRFYRKEGKNWWKNETMEWNRDAIERMDVPLDLLLTHTGPVPAGIPRLSEDYPTLLKKDPSLLDEVHREQAVCTQIGGALRPGHWIFAHFHISASWADSSTHYRVLNVGETEDLSRLNQ